jgi:hypothetical protein
VFGNAYEKSICYVDIKATQYTANNFCAKNGMALFNLASSEAAKSELLGLVRVWLSGSTKAGVWVVGRSGSRCKVVRGDGKVSEIACTQPSSFACEFINACMEFESKKVLELQVVSFSTIKDFPTPRSLWRIHREQDCWWQAVWSERFAVTHIVELK